MKIRLPASVRWLWREWLQPLALAAAVVLPVKSSLADWNYVPSGSMIPSLLPGDLVWVNKLAYDFKVPSTTRHLATWGAPRRGDVVVFYSPADGTRLVKRVIGLPGDMIELRRDRLIVNGVPLRYEAVAAAAPSPGPDRGRFLTEEALPGHRHPVTIQPGRPAMRTFGPIRVPPGRYFMMGDNRDNSFDSRYYGCVPRRSILGRATTVVASADPARRLRPRFDRLLEPVP